MYIFLCYASEDRDKVAPVHALLTAKEHRVFFDQHTLPPGQEFHDRIENAIAECDLMVFFISASSTRRGKFCLTELDLAAKRWPNPAGHVLPVCLEPRLPPFPVYLSTVTVLNPSGNLATSILWTIGLRKTVGPVRSTLAAQVLDLTLDVARSLFSAFLLSLALALVLGLAAKEMPSEPALLAILLVMTMGVFARRTYLRKWRRG